jgi:DNA-binding NarL/FixJ family response regulator
MAHDVERRLRVIVADRETVSRAGLSAILAEDSSVDLVGSAADLDRAREVVRRQQPDVMVASVDDLSGDALESLGSFISATDAPVVLVARDPTVQTIREARRLGAAGLVAKSASVAAIRGAVHAVGEGASVFPRLPRRSGSQPPSDREQQIIIGVADGRTNDEIAGALGLSTRTVASHLRRCFIRYGVSSRTELAMLAVRERWCPEPPVVLVRHAGVA